MNGVEVKPAVYEKKVGRPRKSKRRQPHELEGGSKDVKAWCSDSFRAFVDILDTTKRNARKERQI